MSKAIEENKLTAMIKNILCEFDLFWKFMCTDENNDKNKTNLFLPPSTPVTVFLIARKLLYLWLWNLQTFSLFCWLFCEKLSVIAWMIILYSKFVGSE